MIINYKILIKIIFVFLLNNLCSQTTKIPKNIKTVILKSSKSTGTFIDFGDSIELSFDDLDSDAKDYYYQINHFDYKWTSSNLSKSST